MSPRQRFGFMVSSVLLILASAVLVWASRSGQLTIFGDTLSVTNAELAVTSPIDLAKGAASGDEQLQLVNGVLELAPAARSGNAVFTVGQREVVALHRLVPVLPADSPGDGLSLSFAGSIDGVSFSDYSPEQPVVVDTVNGARRVRPIELGFLIPEGSRFLKSRVVLGRSGAERPQFAGFIVNYSQRDTLESDTTLLVNGTPVASDPTTAVPSAGQPSSLVVTGPRGWLLLVLALGVIGAGGALRLRNQRQEGHDGAAPPPAR